VRFLWSFPFSYDILYASNRLSYLKEIELLSNAWQAWDEAHAPWQHPPMSLVVSDNEVHVWRVNLETYEVYLQHLKASLSSDEQLRADKFYFQRDRNHYIAARGILRSILGRYLACRPSALRFVYSRFGKPALVGAESGQSLFFNVSHSHELALMAFSRVGDIGVDVEYMRPGIEYTRLAQRFFSEYERRELLPLPPAQLHRAFYCCWTRKEAYIKARGLGLQLPLEQFDVSVHPEQPAVFLGSREEGQHIEDWSLYHLLPGTEYAGACVVRGAPASLCCWQWLET
jgi:4'-phosphopantetheinyl transferase